jgi:hypothetical protein
MTGIAGTGHATSRGTSTVTLGMPGRGIGRSTGRLLLEVPGLLGIERSRGVGRSAGRVGATTLGMSGAGHATSAGRATCTVRAPVQGVTFTDEHVKQVAA